jgi:hypothetical protein
MSGLTFLHSKHDVFLAFMLSKDIIHLLDIKKACLHGKNEVKEIKSSEFCSK